MNYINAYYDSTVSALYSASNLCVPIILCHSLKQYWNMKLVQLKADCVFWHNMQVDRQLHGVLQYIRAMTQQLILHLVVNWEVFLS